MHPDTAAALEAPVYRPLLMVEMLFDSAPARVHSGVGEIVWNGNVFNGVAWLGKIGDLQEGESTQSYDIALELSNVEEALIAISLGEHYRGRPLHIWIAYFDEDMRMIGAPLGPWRWRMSTLNGLFPGQNGNLVMTATSRMAQWERRSASRYTDADQRAEYPDDYFFEFTSAVEEKEIEF